MDVKLVKDLGVVIRGGHPWIYADALAVPRRLEAGVVVDVVDGRGRFVARGRFEPNVPIAVRIWSLDRAEPLDDALVHRRVAEALALRAELAGVLGDTDAYRLLNGEGDQVPGVVADRYADTVVLKLDGASALPALPAVVEALSSQLSAHGVRRIYRRFGERETAASGNAQPAVLHGDEPPDEVVIREHGVHFAVDPKRGQKTGFFLDQRDNRRVVARHAAGAEVLNLFSYSGGFSVAAALAGARSTTSVDQSQPALDAARRAFELNGVPLAHHRLVRADAFDVLRELAAAGRRFDLVVVDPPSFAPSEKSLSRALRAYAELNALAARVVAPGGFLATASCSSHVTPDDFMAAVRDGLLRAARRARVLELRAQPPDHPTTPAFSEGRYLKFILLRLL